MLTYLGITAGNGFLTSLPLSNGRAVLLIIFLGFVPGSSQCHDILSPKVSPKAIYPKNRGRLFLADPLILMVGAEGFEPTTR